MAFFLNPCLTGKMITTVLSVDLWVVVSVRRLDSFSRTVGGLRDVREIHQMSPMFMLHKSSSKKLIKHD